MEPPAYKEVTLRQFRSFCETARLGSLTAAARTLRLAHPTVWKQVHALEEHFGVRLVEPHVRGCRLTDEGRVLAELAGPLVNARDSFRDPAINARLEHFDVFRGRPRRMEAFAGDTVREYVLQGYGLGLIALWRSRRGHPGLWQRPMGRWFGHASVYVITKRRPKREELVRAFLEAFRRHHAPGAPSRRPGVDLRPPARRPACPAGSARRCRRCR